MAWPLVAAAEHGPRLRELATLRVETLGLALDKTLRLHETSHVSLLMLKYACN